MNLIICRFTTLFSKILEYTKTYPELKEKLLGMIYTFLVVSCKTMYCESKDKSAQQKENKNHMVAKGMKAFNNMISKGIEYAKQGGFRGKRRNSADLSTSKNNLTEDNDIPLFSDKKKKKMAKMNVLDNSDIKRRNSSKIKGELFFQL